MPPHRSYRLKTWRRSHVDRLRFARQRRVGLPVWPEDGDHSAHSPFSSPDLHRRRLPFENFVHLLGGCFSIAGFDGFP